MTEEEIRLKNIIYEAICEIESDFDNKLTVSDIYKILIRIDDNKPRYMPEVG